MSLVGKLEAVLDLKASAEEHHKKWWKEAHHFPDAVSHHIQDVAVHEGDWESHEAVKVWNYTVDEKPEVFKETIEIDEENNKVTLVGVGGHIMEEMKSFKVTYDFTPKPEGGCTAKITMDYEKLNENIPDPTRYLEFVKKVVIDMDAHLAKNG